jgi:hypothetical protein
MRDNFTRIFVIMGTILILILILIIFEYKDS